MGSAGSVPVSAKATELAILSAAQEVHLREELSHIDTDRSGFVTKEQFIAVLQDSGFEIEGDQELLELLQLLNSNGDCAVNYSEFFTRLGLDGRTVTTVADLFKEYGVQETWAPGGSGAVLAPGTSSVHGDVILKGIDKQYQNGENTNAHSFAKLSTESRVIEHLGMNSSGRNAKEQMLVNWRGTNTYHSARIFCRNSDSTCDVIYSDGEMERGVSAENIRTNATKAQAMDHFVVVCEVHKTESMIGIIYRRYYGGDLERQRQKYWNDRPRSLEEAWIKRVQKWIMQMSSALHKMHSHGDGRVVHNDVKLENVLIDNNDDAYLADFDVAMFPDDPEVPFVQGQMEYTSPEICHTLAFGQPISNLLPHYTQHDMWCLGLMASQLLTGATLEEIRARTVDHPGEMLYDPFSDKTCERWNVECVGQFLPATEQLASDHRMRAAVVGLLQLNPQQRWTASQLLSEISDAH